MHRGGPNGPIIGGGPVFPPDSPPPPTPPSDAGGIGSPPQQRSYPARGPSLGLHEIVFRPVFLAPQFGDPRYQLGPYTPAQRQAFDNGPAGVRMNGFAQQLGGQPTYDGPQCGSSNLSTGTSPVAGVSYGTSDFDLVDHLRTLLGGGTPRIPKNAAVVNHEYNVDLSFGETQPNGLPANGFRIGRGYDRVSGTFKAMSIEGTKADGSNEDGAPAFLLDFIAKAAYLWGSQILTGASGAWTSREASSNFTAPSNSSLYVSGFFEIDSGVTYEIPSDSVLEIG